MGEQEDRDAAIAAARKTLSPSLQRTKNVGSAADLYDNITGGRGAAGLIGPDQGLIDKTMSGGWGTPTEPASAEPVVSPGGGNSSSGMDGDLSAISNEVNTQNFLIGDDGSPKQAPDFYRKQDEDYSSIGGPMGKPLFKKAFEEAPAAMEAASNELEKVKAQKSAEVGKVYDAEAERAAGAHAAYNSRRESDNAALMQRQDKLDQATQFYTNDLADQGKFWTNPGNIIAAISWSLLPIMGGDPTAGVKMINQAIDHDMANRQHAADQTLGALRSNLAGYHKLTEDRQAGDLLADSEARRMAANEVARIAQKFESPISQAQAKASIAELQQRSAVSRMEAFRLWVNSPAQKMAAQLHAARAQGFDGAYGEHGPPANGLNPTAPPGAAGVRGTVNGTPTTASTGTSKGGKVDGFSSPAVAALANASPAAMQKAIIEGRIRGSGDVAEMLRRQVAAEASVHASKGPEAVRAAKYKIVMERADEGRKQAPELVTLAPRIVVIGNMQASIDRVERSMAAVGQNPRQYLDSARAYLPSDWVDRYEKYKVRSATPGAKGSAEEAAQIHAQAKVIFREQMHAMVNTYIHENAGGAVSADEAKRMDSVINPDVTMAELKDFVQRQSKAAKFTESAAIRKMNPIAQLLYLQSVGKGRTNPVNTVGTAPPVAPPTGYNEGPMDGSQSVGVSRPPPNTSR